MALEILVDLTLSDLELIIKLLEVFKGSKKYQDYTEKEKDEFDNLVKKLRDS